MVKFETQAQWLTTLCWEIHYRFFNDRPDLAPYRYKVKTAKGSRRTFLTERKYVTVNNIEDCDCDCTISIEMGDHQTSENLIVQMCSAMSRATGAHGIYSLIEQVGLVHVSAHEAETDVSKQFVDRILNELGDCPEFVNPSQFTIRPDKKTQPSFNELSRMVRQWATLKGIFAKGTPLAQADKTLEEAQEIKDGIEAGDRDEIADGIGDTLVTLIIQARMQNLDIVQCLAGAYGVISKRTGQMVDGQFVKD